MFIEELDMESLMKSIMKHLELSLRRGTQQNSLSFAKINYHQFFKVIALS